MCRHIHILQHAGEESLMLLATHSQLHLRHEVTERQRLRQTLRLALQNRFNFIQQKSAGRVVELSYQ